MGSPEEGRDRDEPVPVIERLSAVDASNLAFEHGGSAYSIGLLAVLDAGPLVAGGDEPDLEHVRRVLAPRVAAIVPLNRKVRLTRWGQGLPIWLDSPADLAQHVRRGPLLDDDAAVTGWCGRLMSEPLPRDRPLWDLTVCAGPAPDVVTAVLRVHHALTDGAGGVRLMQTLFDPAPADSDLPAVPHRAPAASRAASSSSPASTSRPPTARELAADAWRQRLSLVRTIPHRVRRVPSRLPTAARTLATGALRTTAVIRGGMPPTSLLGPVGNRRGVAMLSADLEAVRARAHAHGATVNDALLGAVAAAAAALLTARGETLPPVLPVSVPVSLRRAGDVETPGVGPNKQAGPNNQAGANRVGVMLVPLPLGVPDPAERLHRIAALTRDAAAEARRAGTFELTRSRLGTRIFDVLARHQHTIGLFITNVPGPAEPLRLGGSTLRQAWPLSTLGGNVRLAVAALSYAGTLFITVTYDLASCPDVDVFTAELAAGLQPF